MSKQEQNNQEIREHLIALITSEIGLCVTYASILWLRSVEDEHPYSITYEGDKEVFEMLYENATEAVDEFLRVRTELKMGEDFEV